MENGLINFEDNRVIETLKQTVAQNASPEEFAMFTQFCKSTGLNPFKKEIWFIKAGGRVQIMTGINGYLAIANSHPQFDGMEVDVEVAQNGRPLKAVCKVYRKDRRFPSVGIALMSEFEKPSPIWKQMPSVMLQKVAKSIALKEAFPQELNGLYTEEEMPREFSAPTEIRKVEPTPLPEPIKYSIPEPLTREQELYFAKRGITKDDSTGYYMSSIDLGPKLEAYKVKPTNWEDEAKKAQEKISKEMEAA